ncbi:MAG: pirin family protein [Nonlabens sp.]
MKTSIYRSEDRGHANHGWLVARHSFSFASWYNPSQINFGVLRVLNDDIIAAGAGFPTHPHDNMEIITIPLSGTLEHKDSMGNKAQIKTGEVQVMSAGTGVTHSEYNASQTEELKLFQIWLFPNKKNVEPRYDQQSINTDLKNEWHDVITPSKSDDSMWLHQEAWMSIGEFDASSKLSYDLRGKNSGVYIMVIEGSISIGDTELKKRDAIGIEEVGKVHISATKNARILLMELPMEI